MYPVIAHTHTHTHAHKEDGLFVSTWSKIYRMPLHRCGRFDTCRYPKTPRETFHNIDSYASIRESHKMCVLE